MALRSAELAAATLRAAFEGHLTWERAPGAYSASWTRVFIPRLRWGALLETALLSSQLAGLACWALHLVPSLMGPVYRSTRDIVPACTNRGTEGVWPG